MICISTDFTKEVLLAALDKGKPIFVEKPVVWKLEDILEILNHGSISITWDIIVDFINCQGVKKICDFLMEGL